VTTLEEHGKVRARNTRTIEQHSVEQHSSSAVVIGHRAVGHHGVSASHHQVAINGGSDHHLSAHREASFSSIHSRGSSHHDLSGHSSAIEGESYTSGGGYGALRRSEGKTLYQRKMVSTGGDEIGLVHHESHGGYANHHDSSAVGSKTYVREVSSSKMSSGGSLRHSTDGGSAHIATVSSRVGQFESHGGSSGHQKVHHKFQRHQRTWDHGESAI